MEREIPEGQRKLLPIPPEKGKRGQTAYEAGVESWTEKRDVAYEKLKGIKPGEDNFTMCNALEEYETAHLKLRHLKRRKSLGLIK